MPNNFLSNEATFGLSWTPASQIEKASNPTATGPDNSACAPAQVIRKRNYETGVTILEMALALLMLTVGLLALAGSIGYAVTVSNKGRNITNAKLLVVSLLEQMETLRNTEQLTFGQIANAGAVDNTDASRNFSGF